MPIVLARVDDRLIHGQVVEGWLPYLKVDQVVVVSDSVSKDDTQQALMRLALPDSVEMKVLGIQESVEYFKGGQTSAHILILVPSPHEILEMLRQGIVLKSVNIGGMHYSAGRIQVGRAIFLSSEDRNDLKELVQRGVVLEGRAVPSDHAQNIAEIIQ
ncbi:MAG: PTS sugar transporter subunit IIB [Elusimicrobia bacterium]|nr:PTS sugar transporter subunit IIB [Elusimicrobiota bacterium]